MPKILIVEDEQAIRDSVEFFLSSAGYEVETAVSSQDALTVSNRVLSRHSHCGLGTHGQF